MDAARGKSVKIFNSKLLRLRAEVVINMEDTEQFSNAVED